MFTYRLSSAYFLYDFHRTLWNVFIVSGLSGGAVTCVYAVRHPDDVTTERYAASRARCRVQTGEKSQFRYPICLKYALSLMKLRYLLISSC